VILYWGIYDPELLNLKGGFAAFLRTATWSYFGSKDFEADPRMAQFSVVRHVTAQFPPMFLSAGNADPLAAHSKQLAAIAESRGVAVDSLFFPDDYIPPLSHEYQFDLDTAAGQTALDRSLKFLAANTNNK
jgi:acetyl esterase